MADSNILAVDFYLLAGEIAPRRLFVRAGLAQLRRVLDEKHSGKKYSVTRERAPGRYSVVATIDG